MRRVAPPILAALLAVLPPVWTASARTDPTIRAAAVALDPANPAQRTLGRLTFLDGWVLSSGDSRFGGLSSLAVESPGRLVALSDSGIVVRLAVERTVSGTMAALPMPPGAKRSVDAESLTHDPVTGRFWAGFEFRNAIARFDLGFSRRESEARPATMAGWSENGGPEALTQLSDGRFLVIAEKAVAGRDGRPALLFAGDPTDRATPPPVAFVYRPPEGASPSDAAALPDGRVLVLNRRWSPPLRFAAEITLIDPRRVRGGAVLTGEPVAKLAPPLTVDNMEGIAVEQVGGRTIVWLVSDDNFLPLERTLLLRFRLDR